MFSTCTSDCGNVLGSRPKVIGMVPTVLTSFRVCKVTGMQPKNPAYLIRTAHEYLADDEPKLAEELFTKEYEMDQNHGFIALYFRALAVLKQGHQHFEAKKKRVAINSTYHKRAKEDFCQAQFIAGEVSCYVGGVLAAFNSDPTCALSQQFNNVVGLLTLFQQQCQHAIAMIDECEITKNRSLSWGKFWVWRTVT